MFRVLSRRENTEGDKCPQCRMVSVDFMDLGNGLLGCYHCGSVFVRKAYRRRGVSIPVGPLPELPVMGVEKAVRESVPVTAMGVGIPGVEEIVKGDPLTCPECGKVCKNKIGLAGHRRSHK